MNKLVLKFHIDRIKGYAKRFLINSVYRMKLRPFRAQKRYVLYLVFEPKRKHPGIADRIKAVVAMYNHCKKYDYAFKMFFETPFKLSDYLVPKFDWDVRLEDLEYSINDTKIINMHPIPRLKPGKQYHCYCYSGNNMPKEFPDTGYKWSTLFHELFKPSEEMERAYRDLGIQPKSYMSVHFRFVNALEQFENTFFKNSLKTEEERDDLIKRCRNGIMEIYTENSGIDIYVFSDSKIFLDSIQDLPVKVLPHDNISHVAEGANEDGQFKSFFDLYVMSQSMRVYRVQSPELYNWSEYARMAAMIGDVEFCEKKI